MSTQVQLHIRTDEMTEGHLTELGVNGPMAQLASSGGPSITETFEVVGNAPNFIVGNSAEDHAHEIQQTISDPREITDSLINQVEAAYDGTDASASGCVEFLEEHKGEKVFSVGH